MAKQKNNWENVERYFVELQDWWKKDIKYTVKNYKKDRKSKKSEGGEVILDGTQSEVKVDAEMVESENDNLQEVVVQGYASRTRKSISYSVQTISSEEISSAPKSNISTQLQGRVGGINIEETPNNDVIAIRGMGSITKTNEPLIVVDGEVFNGKLSDFNQDDIQSMNVFKDASATAI